MTVQSPNPELAALPDLYLFDSRNRKFLEDRSQPLGGEQPVTPMPTKLRIMYYLSYFLLVFLSLLVVSGIAQEWIISIRLAFGADTAQGVITAHRPERCHVNPGYLSYAFTVPEGSQEGQTYTVEQPVNRDTCKRLADGSAVQINYLPDDPGVARLAGVNADTSYRDYETWSLALTVLLLLVTPQAVTLYQAQRNRRLRNEGRVLRGQIIQCQKRGWISPRWIWLRYSVITPDGKERQLSAVVVDPKARAFFEPRRLIRDLPEPGTRIAVLYLNDKLHKVL